MSTIMVEIRTVMNRVLREHVVPALRARGFQGAFPHFRRLGAEGTDLLSIQFDRHGGGFVVELGRGPAGNYATPWGRVIPPTRLRALDLSIHERVRMQPGRDGSTLSWFRYDTGLGSASHACERAAREMLALLPQADAWWSGARKQPSIRAYASDERR